MKNVIGNTKYFSDYFKVRPIDIENYGAFDISLIFDLPLFIDPFLLFNSKKPAYKKIHNDIIKYLKFLRDNSQKKYSSFITERKYLETYFLFPEVTECWLGYCPNGNEGAGLQMDFARTLHEGLGNILKDIEGKGIARSAHLEKVCLIADRVDRDKISDFTANLMKGYLLDYTQIFAKKYIDPTLCKVVTVPRTSFDYKTSSFVDGTYLLPWYVSGRQAEFVLLTPVDILRKDTQWINKHDLVANFDQVRSIVTDASMQIQIDTYFNQILKVDPETKEATQKDYANAATSTIFNFPALIDYYIKYKEETGDAVVPISKAEVREITEFFVNSAKIIIDALHKFDFFKAQKLDSFEEAVDAIKYFRHVIEHNDLYRSLYVDGKPIQYEDHVKRMLRLVFRKSNFSYDTEVNNGRGPCDSKISNGAEDCTIIEFKLASNKQLKNNLLKQLEVYQEANNTNKGIKAILYFTEEEYSRVIRILKEIEYEKYLEKTIFLIDARNDNKPSASKTKGKAK